MVGSESSDTRLEGWNAHYDASDTVLPPPADVLLRAAEFLPDVLQGEPPPRALDFACGRAANAEWLAARGFETWAWDYSASAIDSIRRRTSTGLVHAEVRDVIRHPPEPERFDLVVVSRFLHRDICPAIQDALRLKGVLFYQTFTRGLRNPAFMLSPGELLELFPALQVAWYEEAPEADEHGRAEAMLVAQRI